VSPRATGLALSYTEPVPTLATAASTVVPVSVITAVHSFSGS
jgi:hypothetical protein